MVSLSLMARLLEAVRPDARLILVGDPEQLASVEAGAVLGDIVGPASLGTVHAARRRGSELAAVTGQAVPPDDGRRRAPFGDGIVVLRDVHRHGGAIAALARAIRRDDADEAIAVLRARRLERAVDRRRCGRARPRSTALRGVRALAVDDRSCRHRVGPGRATPATAIEALGSFRLLCAPPAGPRGRGDVDGAHRELAPGRGRGLRHRHGLVRRPSAHRDARTTTGCDLYNGDTGVVVEAESGRLVAAFERRGTIAEVSPTRLAAVDTVYAMTVHKSQGSQYQAVAFLLPSPDSRVLTRELLYTAVTRARERLILVGPEESIRAAIERPITRASGLAAGPLGRGRPDPASAMASRATIPQRRIPAL